MNAAPQDSALAIDAQRGIHSLQRMVGRHCRATLINGDCLAALNDIVCDVVITDPPYGVTQNEWDNLQATMQCFDALTTPIVCTCQNPASSELVVRYKKRFKWSDVWEKTQAVGFLNCKVMPMRQHEDILIFADGKIPYWPQLMQKNRVNIRPHVRSIEKKSNKLLAMRNVTHKLQAVL